MNNKKSHIALNINFQDRISKDCVSEIVVELFRSLLHQRQQIPVQYKLLKHDVEQKRKEEIMEREEEEEEKEEEDECHDLNPRERIKLKKRKFQMIKQKQRYLRKASDFLEKMEEMSVYLKKEIMERDLDTVSFLFGATPVSPKETFHVHLPYDMVKNDSSTPSTVNFKAQRVLFRSLVTHETLFTLIGKPLVPTNVFVAFKQKYLQPNSPWFHPRPHLSSTQHRGHVVEFNLLVPEVPETPFSLSKLPLDAKTPGIGRWMREAYTPVPMDLCTPFTITKSAKNQRRSVEDESEQVTPVKRLCAARNLQSDFINHANDNGGNRVEEIEESTDLLGIIPEEEEEECLEEMKKKREQDETCLQNLILDVPEERWFISSGLLKGFK